MPLEAGVFFFLATRRQKRFGNQHARKRNSRERSYMQQGIIYEVDPPGVLTVFTSRFVLGGAVSIQNTAILFCRNFRARRDFGGNPVFDATMIRSIRTSLMEKCQLQCVSCLWNALTN